MGSNVTVFIEIQNGGVRKITPQLVFAGRELAQAGGGRLYGLVVGSSVGKIAEQAAGLGFDEVVVADNPILAAYTAESCTEAVCTSLDQLGGGILILGNTSIGKDIGPRIAQRRGLGMVSDVTQTVSIGEKPVFKHPIYAGKALAFVEVQEPEYVVSIRANSYPPAPAPASPCPIRNLDIALDAGKFRTQLKEVIERAAGKVDLTEADIIVSGGMGVKGPEGFEFLKPLAEVLGAALGSSRAAVLAGYIHPSHQVGQTGKTVSPSLYIACGISGAIQHKAGMSTSKRIVAINSDPEAPMFEIADYGIVGDLFQVVPPLVEELKKILQS
jgi:electron transfer flavoprotein alpha subunit